MHSGAGLTAYSALAADAPIYAAANGNGLGAAVAVAGSDIAAGSRAAGTALLALKQNVDAMSVSSWRALQSGIQRDVALGQS